MWTDVRGWNGRSAMSLNSIRREKGTDPAPKTRLNLLFGFGLRRRPFLRRDEELSGRDIGQRIAALSPRQAQRNPCELGIER